MNEPLFSIHAPAYLAAGMPVIPLYSREKKPCVMDWSRFHNTLPDEATQQSWLTQYPAGNMGLALGEASGVMMLDIDSDSEDVTNAILRAVPPSPWHRRGKKGVMLAYRYRPIKTFRVKQVSGAMVVECLSSRTQCVLPPSIHPDTQLPYTSNCDLLSVRQALHELPDNIEEILRAAVKAAGVELSHSGWSRVTDYVSAGSRDTTLTELAGLFAYAVTRGERTLKEAIGMLASYHAEYVETVSGDAVDLQKHISNLIRFLHRDVIDRGKVLPIGWDKGYTPEELVNLGINIGDDHIEWSFAEIMEYLAKEMEANAEADKRSELIERILKKVARSPSLSTLDEERILQFIRSTSGLAIGIAVLKRRLKELRAGGVEGNDHSEIAQATIKDFEQHTLLRMGAGQLHKWGGSHWVPLNNGAIERHVSTHYGHLPACKRNSDMIGITKLISTLVPFGLQDPTKAHLNGINFSNGFLTSELTLLPHDPGYGMTYTLPFRYVPEDAGKALQFEEFLFRCWGRDEDFEQKVQSLREAMAATLFGMGARFQKAILLHGAPKSGKTQLLRILESMLPASARCSVPPNEWNDKFLPAQMHNRVLNICGELSDRSPIDGQTFKDIIDGSERSVQHKNLPIFTMKPLCSHWFASNHMPKTRDTSSGFIRRWLFFTFHYPVSDSDIKLDVGDQIAASEREAISAWAIGGLKGLIERGKYTLPASHTQIVHEFANLNNSVRYYLLQSNKVKLDVVDGHVTETKMFNSYWAFCMGAGSQKPVPVTQFRAMMRELQSELKFKLKIAESRFGGSEALYENVSVIG